MDEAKKLRERAAAALNLAKMEAVKDHRASLIVLASIWIETAKQLERQAHRGRPTVRDMVNGCDSGDTGS